MKAWQLTRFDIDGLQLADLPPVSPLRGHVLVRWHAYSINYRDLVIVQGTYLPNLPLPFTPLSDAAGEVVAVGEDVTEWKPGDRVISHYITSWQSGPPTPENVRRTLGGTLPGLLAEVSTVPAEALVPLPEYLSFDEGATLPIAALTAWSALFTAADLAPGATVLLEGTGGVSVFGLQLAHAAGLRTIITSGSDEKLARARALGAEHTLNYRTMPAWAEHVREFTAGAGADLVLEVGGPATIQQAIRAVRMGGRIAVIGFLGGTALSIDAMDLISGAVRLHGVRVGSRAMFLDLLRFMSEHRIAPQLDRTFAFHDVPAAFRHLAVGAHFGKIVISAAA